jgi:hypothetical protein
MTRPMSAGGWPLRDLAPSVLLAAIGSATVAWLGLYGFAWSDYETEVLPSVNALVEGHVLQFLRLAPAYGGSLVLRAPFALIPGLWSGGELSVYRMLALPCLLASAWLAVWLLARMRNRERGTLARGIALALCVANPLTVRALEVGHPEELLGGALCVGAVLLAARDRPALAGLALGAAIANKEWALLAVGPVLLALPSRRILCMAVAGSSATVALAPLALVGSSSFLAATRGTASTSSAIFQPWQIWWFFGHHGAVVHGLFGTLKPGYRTGPTWTGAISHPLILAVALALSGLAWLQHRGQARSAAGRGASSRVRASQGDALLLLALLLLARCLLDTWDTEYYMLPFVLALLSWEALEHTRPPVLALSATALAWVSFQSLAADASADLQAVLFLAWTLPLGLALAAALYAPRWVWSPRGRSPIAGPPAAVPPIAGPPSHPTAITSP